ncbi:MAG: bifunctional hydroxymethylpyrimidine kinase/phosphomethylpyrimidine kinase [Betaproteobacteria bacterium]
MHAAQSPPAVLAFAASDPTGGAGVQADLLTLAALGCHPLSVLTALTAQDTHGVEALLPVEPDWVRRQARRVLSDVAVHAFKLGVLGSAANAAAVAEIVAQHARVPLVVDPVLASGRGDALAVDDVVSVLRTKLLPLATLATPNVPEAARLGGVRAMLDAGCRYVLVTGTHDQTPQVVNRLHDASGLVAEERWERLPGSYHGSGCTLASAIAGYLALGKDVVEACRLAQAFTWASLRSAFRPGGGQFIPRRRAK